jgi:hypothetical protein
MIFFQNLKILFLGGKVLLNAGWGEVADDQEPGI